MLPSVESIMATDEEAPKLDILQPEILSKIELIELLKQVRLMQLFVEFILG